MSTPKKHHFVPKFILRRFADDTGKLHFFDKRIAEKRVLARTPEDLFLERHLYSIIDSNGDKDTKFEKCFASIEDNAAPIVKKIVDAARANKTPQLMKVEKEILNRFVYFQWKRVPDQFNRPEATQGFETYLEESIAEFEALYRPLTEAERTRFEDQSTRARLRRNASIMAVAEPGVEVQEALEKKGLGVALIQKHNKSFVIGSSPVIKFAHSGDSDIRNPLVELWFPIAADVAVISVLRRGAERLVIPNDNAIRAINKAIFRQSTLIAGHSPELVASLSKFFRQNSAPT